MKQGNIARQKEFDLFGLSTESSLRSGMEDDFDFSSVYESQPTRGEGSSISRFFRGFFSRNNRSGAYTVEEVEFNLRGSGLGL